MSCALCDLVSGGSFWPMANGEEHVRGQTHLRKSWRLVPSHSGWQLVGCFCFCIQICATRSIFGACEIRKIMYEPIYLEMSHLCMPMDMKNKLCLCDLVSGGSFWPTANGEEHVRGQTHLRKSWRLVPSHRGWQVVGCFVCIQICATRSIFGACETRNLIYEPIYLEMSHFFMPMDVLNKLRPL